jgi:penicillin-binding protein-related factor A (putative recombinase)
LGFFFFCFENHRKMYAFGAIFLYNLNNNYNKNTKIKKFIEMVQAQGTKINILNIHLSTSKATQIKYFLDGLSL